MLGSALLLAALRAPRLSQTVVLLLAVQLALSVFSRSDYLFTSMALTACGPMPSDVAVMAERAVPAVLGLGRALRRAVARPARAGRRDLLPTLNGPQPDDPRRWRCMRRGDTVV